MSGCFTPDSVTDALIAARPLIAQQILDLSIKHPNWLAELFSMEEWPNGEGTILQQLVFKGGRPQIERDFNKWKRVENLNGGCGGPTEGPNCSYNMTQFSGSGFERHIVSLMSRDFKTPSYCVKEIQTTSNFEIVFAKIIENIYAQRDFFIEFNIGQNYLTSLAKKFVVDSGGAKFNPNNIYTYRNIGSARLSTLNMEMLEFFYEQMRRIPSSVPYDTVDGSPIYSIMASHQLLARMYRDDNQLRQDVRFSGKANDLLTKYNFMSTVRGMFIAAPILYPRRFVLVGGAPIEVLPFINDVPMEVGTSTSLNPEYEAATHEEVLLHGMSPFKTYYKPTVTTLGQGTSFGPEASFMGQWDWVNPQTPSDPARREGFFFANAEIGLAAQHSEGIFGILVERPNRSLMAMYTPNAADPVTQPTLSNFVPTSTCPCPLVVNAVPSLFTTNGWEITFFAPTSGTPEDTVTFTLDSGLTVSGTLAAITADGLNARVTFAAALPSNFANQVVGIGCGGSLLCNAKVDYADDCRSGQLGTVDMILSNGIKAGVGGVITAFFGNCTQANLTITKINASTLTYTVRYTTGFGPMDNPTGIILGNGNDATPFGADMICDRGGIIGVCVPTATDASCPACVSTIAVCSGAQA